MPPVASTKSAKADRPKLTTAVGSYAEMPPVALLVQYLSEELRRSFVESMALVKVKQGECIMRQGDKGNNFYLIKEGTCDVEVESGEKRTLMRTLGPGSWCGEQSLLTGDPRSATVIGTSPEVTLLMVNRRMFNSCVGELIKQRRETLGPFLAQVSIFSELRDPYESFLIADALGMEGSAKEFGQGSTIHEPGRPSDGLFYLVESGSVEVPGSKTKYGRADFFGQVELLQGAANQEKRVAATTEDGTGKVRCYTLAKEDFMKLVPLHAFVNDTAAQQFALRSEPARPRGRRYGESADPTTQAMGHNQLQMPKGSTKSPDALARIMSAIKRNIIFSRLSDTQLQMLQQVMSEHHVSAGQNVVTQGEKGNHFYVVDAGELDVYIRPDGATEEQAVKAFGPGDSFGELALMYNCPRTATIRARTDVVLWSLDRVSFKLIVLEANTKKATLYESFLEKVQLLESLSKDQRNRMVDALEEVQYKPGEPIINEDEEGTHFYMIVEGEVSVTKQGQAGELARRGVSDYFGELSLKTGAKTMATVSAAGSKTVKLVRMDRGAFLRLLGPLDSSLEMRKYTASGAELTAGMASGEGEESVTTAQEIPSDHVFEKAQEDLTLKHFTVTSGTLGEGAFGKVRRCKLNSDGRVFALKQMQKADIVQMGQVEHIMQETQILSRISHPFVTNKFGSISTPSNLILIMEFCPGGDLFDQLYKHKAFTTADAAIFTMQVLLPLEYLHSLGIVHRDLKLENVLVAQDGALKLTDFGFAKYIKYRSWTLCGTPEYLAPELILEKGHGKAVDYWAFGVIFFEMLNGNSPFEAEDHLATYSKILDGTVNYPAKMDADAVDLIGKLLQKDISRRYGNLKDGTADIKNHKFYTSRKFDWSNYAQRGGAFKLPPFDSSKYEWLPADKVVTDAKRCSPEHQALFDGF